MNRYRTYLPSKWNLEKEIERVKGVNMGYDQWGKKQSQREVVYGLGECSKRNVKCGVKFLEIVVQELETVVILE